MTSNRSTQTFIVSFHATLLAVLFATPAGLNADVRVYDFDDGTFQGWSYVNVNDEPYPIGDDELTDVGWIVSEQDIDLGENGWQLLQGSTVNGIGEVGDPQREPNFRIIPEPWENRDCLDSNECQTQLLKSPTFTLDASGPISIDMMGGQATDGREFDPETDFAPEFPEDFNFLKNGDGWQGFALYDVADDAYVRWGFPTFNNDGKEKDGREVWEQVTIPQEELADLAGDGKEYRIDVFDSYLGGWGWIGIDTVQIPDASFVAEEVSDVFDCDGDGVTGAGDLACITNVSDRDIVLAATNSLPGDLDGNGDVAFADFLVLSANFGNETGEYSDGNIDMTGGIAFSDFLVLSANFGQIPTAAQAVPEPGAGLMTLFGTLGLLALRTKRRAR